MAHNLKVVSGTDVKVISGAKVIVQSSASIPVAPWDGGTIYNIGDGVSHDSKTWVCNHYAPAGAGPFGGYLDGTAPGHAGIIYWVEVV